MIETKTATKKKSIKSSCVPPNPADGPNVNAMSNTTIVDIDCATTQCLH